MLYFSEIWIIITNSHRSTIQRLSSWLVGCYKKACVLHPAALHLPPHRVDHDPKVAAEHDPAQVAHDQVELVRAHLEIGAVEGLRNVPDEDENVECEAEAVPDQPEHKEDPRGGSDPVDEQAAGGHTRDRETNPCAPGNGPHHWRCLSFYLCYCVKQV